MEKSQKKGLGEDLPDGNKAKRQKMNNAATASVPEEATEVDEVSSHFFAYIIV